MDRNPKEVNTLNSIKKLKEYASSQSRHRMSDGNKMAYYKNTKDEKRVLIIGDIHAPFTLEGYLEFCYKAYLDYNCNEVVFAGDIIDNHYASYHETDADGLGGKDELERAIEQISLWYAVFPKAKVCIGNHDAIVSRKAQSGNIPTPWIKSYSEVLDTPNWDYQMDFEIDGVSYAHGIGGKAHIAMRRNMQSRVQGHLHSEASVIWTVGSGMKFFGLQVGCGIDRNAYAMAYGRDFPRPAIGCGIVIGGHTALNVLMDL